MVDFKELYSYFSHNFRTNVATIIATIEAAKLDLIDIKSDEMNSVYESAYLLDLFDASLSICIDYITNNEIDKNFTEINPNKYIENLIKELSSYIEENSYPIHTNLNEFTVKSNEFIIKNLLQLIASEMFRLSPEGCSIKSDNKNFIFKPKNKFDDLPKVFDLFKSILNECYVDFNYNENEIRLEFK